MFETAKNSPEAMACTMNGSEFVTSEDSEIQTIQDFAMGTKAKEPDQHK